MMRSAGVGAFLFTALLLPACSVAAEHVVEVQQGVPQVAGDLVLVAISIHASESPPDVWVSLHGEKGSGRAHVTEGGYNLVRLGDDDYAVFIEGVEKGSPDKAALRIVQRDPGVSWSAWIANLGKK